MFGHTDQFVIELTLALQIKSDLIEQSCSRSYKAFFHRFPIFTTTQGHFTINEFTIKSLTAKIRKNSFVSEEKKFYRIGYCIQSKCLDVNLENFEHTQW